MPETDRKFEQIKEVRRLAVLLIGTLGKAEDLVGKLRGILAGEEAGVEDIRGLKQRAETVRREILDIDRDAMDLLDRSDFSQQSASRRRD